MTLGSGDLWNLLEGGEVTEDLPVGQGGRTNKAQVETGPLTAVPRLSLHTSPPGQRRLSGRILSTK